MADAMDITGETDSERPDPVPEPGGDRRGDAIDRRRENLNKWWEIDWMLRKIEQRVSWLEEWSRAQALKQGVDHERLAGIERLLGEARVDLKIVAEAIAQRAAESRREQQKLLWFAVSASIGVASFLAAQLFRSMNP